MNSLLLAAAGLCLALIGCGSNSSSDGGHNDSGPADAGQADALTDSAQAGCKTIMTKSGPVEGATSGMTCSYQGIPFAAPPTGALRWKPPQPAISWTTPRPSVAGSGCPQIASDFGAASSDEDCLYLNVWTPTEASTTPRPVMVYVFGGGFISGSGNFPLYDGTNLANATGNIVVTLNYRLGALGFLSNPALRAEDSSFPTSGNYGILDQIAAFEWVHENIASFGGSPSNVTIFGESAGGISMFIHLVSPKSKGLFQHVIIESGAAVNGNVAFSLATADSEGASFATSLGCNDSSTLLTCMRGKSVSAILAASPEFGIDNAGFYPTTDGVVIPQEPMTMFSAGDFTKVPTLLGNNKNEGTLFIYSTPPTDNASYLALIDSVFPGNGAAIIAQYPVSNYGGSYFQAASDVATDGVFLCPTRKIARALTKSGTPTYRYDFDHAISFPFIPNLGAFHGSELMFVFGNKLLGLVALQSDELPLSREIMGYWGNMAAHGNPNVAGAFLWPEYQMTTEPEIILDLTLSTTTELKSNQCDFWDGLFD